jgi:hypothetical protein
VPTGRGSGLPANEARKRRHADNRARNASLSQSRLRRAVIAKNKSSPGDPGDKEENATS